MDATDQHSPPQDTAADEAGLLYTGKAKRVYAAAHPERVRIVFTDGATAFNGVKRGTFADKGQVNARISAHLMRACAAAGVPTHLIEESAPDTHLCHRVEIIPVEVVVRNVAAGSLSKRFGIPEGQVLERPLVEFFYKSDELNDPPMSDEHALLFGWARPWELAYLREASVRVNDVLTAFWSDLDVTLVDFKLEFGRAADGRILLADEISPDGSRLWEKGTGKRFDKDVFRRDLGDLGDRYRELLGRVFGEGAAR
jgi:phosphoribosylaminoimidazole-succinocarboxamide synthase